MSPVQVFRQYSTVTIVSPQKTAAPLQSLLSSGPDLLLRLHRAPHHHELLFKEVNKEERAQRDRNRRDPQPANNKMNFQIVSNVTPTTRPKMQSP
jgi:hypothetical protein